MLGVQVRYIYNFFKLFITFDWSASYGFLRFLPTYHLLAHCSDRITGEPARASSRSFKNMDFPMIGFGPTPILVINLAAFRSDHHSDVSLDVKNAFARMLINRAVNMML